MVLVSSLTLTLGLFIVQCHFVSFLVVLSGKVGKELFLGRSFEGSSTGFFGVSG